MPTDLAAAFRQFGHVGLAGDALFDGREFAFFDQRFEGRRFDEPHRQCRPRKDR